MCQQDLAQVLSQLPKFTDPKILVGGDTMDDAGVYQLRDDLAIVQTVDVLTPIADDPYVFGQIAAANSLSDVYAMGGRPVTALCIMGFPVGEIDNQVIRRMLEGVVSKVREAEACLLGGHTLKDPEVKCGLSVTGVVSPHKIVTNSNAKPGDKLILTKPLGVGVISTALKADHASLKAIEKANFYMCQLNRMACETMVEVGVSSATDITGFGLLGHAWEMAQFSNVSMVIYGDQVSVIEEAFELAKASLFPSGSVMNFEFVKPKANFSQNISTELQMLLCDAQTSGGLLIAVPEERCETLLNLLHTKSVTSARIIGDVIEPKERRIYVE